MLEHMKVAYTGSKGEPPQILPNAENEKLELIHTNVESPTPV